MYKSFFALIYHFCCITYFCVNLGSCTGVGSGPVFKYFKLNLSVRVSKVKDLKHFQNRNIDFLEIKKEAHFREMNLFKYIKYLNVSYVI